MNVTVFGATGVVGRALVPLLSEHKLTRVSRTAPDEPGARWLVADAASGDGVAAAVERADVVYYLVHSLGARDFEEQDRAPAEMVARKAGNAGVRQIVYLGGLGADRPDASPQLRSRRQTGERLASAGVPVTTLGRKPAIVEVPVLTPYLSPLWLNLVTPVNASVARPLVEGLRSPTIAREERIRRLLSFELTSFDEAARRALA